MTSLVRINHRKPFLLALLSLLLSGSLSAQSWRVETVAENLGIPWGMAWLDSRTVLFTERSGRAGTLNTQSGDIRWLDGLPEVYDKGQGGLLDVAVTADYKPGSWIYFTYSKPRDGGAVTTLARARLDGDALTDWQDMLVTDSATDTTRHFGSRIAFDGAGHLFFSVGDRGQRPNGQDLSTHAGSILRLKLDGSVPADNPFVGREDALPEIYSYGHRNPQGLCYDHSRDGLWAGEHGPRGGDEINWIEPGVNYGWPEVSHGKEYWGPIAVGEKHKPGMEDPRKVYVPSIAPGSLLCYSGEAFPEWRGNLFQGALKLTHLNRVVMDDQGFAAKEERLLDDREYRIRALSVGPEGAIYFSTDSGNIMRLSATAQ